MPVRHALVGRIPAVARIQSDVVGADHALAGEGRAEHLRVPRHGEFGEFGRIDARDRVEHIAFAGLVTVVVEEGAELRIGQGDTGIRDKLHDLFHVELRRQAGADPVQGFQSCALLAQRLFGPVGVVDVDCKPDITDQPAAGIEACPAGDLHPAIVSFGMAEARLVAIVALLLPCPGAQAEHHVQIIRMDDRHPIFSGQPVGRDSGDLLQRAVGELDAVRTGDPDRRRGAVRHRPEARLTLAQGLARRAHVGDVVDDLEEAIAAFAAADPRQIDSHPDDRSIRT